MNKEIKEKWIQALRSGEYKKGKAALRIKKDTFCCLGVLCDIYHKETEKGQWELKIDGCYDFNPNTKRRSVVDDAILPPLVKRWANLEYTNPFIPALSTSLAELNDTGKSFKVIADIIEKHL